MRTSSLVAGVGFATALPGSIAAAYLGYTYGLYPYLAVPVVVAVLLAAALLVLFPVLSRLRDYERDRAAERERTG